MCLGQGADLHMAQLMPLPLTISCSSELTLVLSFWCWLTWVVPDKIQDGCKMVALVCVCVLGCARACVTCTGYWIKATSTNKSLHRFGYATIYTTTLLVYQFLTTSTLY